MVRPLTDLTPVTYNGTTLASLALPFWYPEVGLFAFTNDGANFGFYRITLDGVAQFVMADSVSRVGFNVGTQKILTESSGVYSIRDPLALIGIVYTENYPITGATSIFSYFGLSYWASMPGFTLWGAGSTVFRSDSNPTASAIGSIPELAGLGFHHIGPGRNSGEIFLSATGGSYTAGCFYNVGLNIKSSPVYYVDVCQSLMYAPEYGVLIQNIGANIRVWSLEVDPSSLSDPVFYSGSLQRGGLASFKTQALGAQGEFAVNEVVNWSASMGQVLDPTSITNEKGEAVTRILFGSDQSGSLTVSANLLE